MAQRRSKRNNHAPLIIEPHPESYEGYEFITLIQYKEKSFLTIVNNATDKTVESYVLDLCGPEGINEEMIISIVAEWYDDEEKQYPVSIEFSRRNIVNETSRIFRTYNIDFITRVIGPLPKYNMTENISVKRKRKRPIDPGIEIRRSNLLTF